MILQQGEALAPEIIEEDVTISSDLSEATEVKERILAALRAHHFEKEIFGINLSLDEALTNAIKHGNQHDPEKKVRIAYTVNGQRFNVRIVDEGPGFDTDEVPDPRADENVEKASGRGVFLMKYYMSEVRYELGNRCLVLSLSKTSAEK